MSFAPSDELRPQRIVGVIVTGADLRRAIHMRNPPDLFEVRLDALCDGMEAIEEAIGRLRAPLIITARHPLEGGFNQLSAQKRRSLLLRFLPSAAFVDIEFRSADGSAMVVDEARARGAGIIISFHDLDDTPSHKRLCEIARTARLLNPACLKIATRTDTPAQLARLLDFFQVERGKMIIAAMGMGRLGVVARREFFRRGSLLTYGNLGEATIAGQPSISSIRRWSKGSGQKISSLLREKLSEDVAPEFHRRSFNRPR